jgi:hypothetical protein
MRYTHSKLRRNWSLNNGSASDDRTVFCPYLASHSNEITETSNRTLSNDTLQPVHVWSESVSKEGHFITDACSIFRRHLAPHFNKLKETSNVALAVRALPPVHVWYKSVSNEGHFTRQANTFFLPYLASHVNQLY